MTDPQSSWVTCQKGASYYDTIILGFSDPLPSILRPYKLHKWLEWFQIF